MEAHPQYVERHEVAVLTDGSGDFSGFTPLVSGRVWQVCYTPDGTSPLDTGADLDITGESSGVVIANHDNIGTAAFTRAYRQATHGVDGSASLYAAAGEPVETPVVVANERIKVAIAQGGAAKQGTFHIYVGWW